jgi:hypothetical protein
VPGNLRKKPTYAPQSNGQYQAYYTKRILLDEKKEVNEAIEMCFVNSVWRQTAWWHVLHDGRDMLEEHQ